MTKIHTFINDEALAAEIYLNASTGRFHVIMKDLDAGMQLPTIMIFKVEDAAVAYAKDFVEG